MNRTAATVPPQSGTVKSIVLFLHGYGSNAEDLISLAPYFARSLPDTLFISPNAPEPCEMGPYGYQWFSLRDRTPSVIDAEGTRVSPQLAAEIQELAKAHNLPLGKIALVGFSQGTMMALQVAARLPDPLAAVVGFSGKLLNAETLEAETTARPPILLVHGTADEVVPHAALPAAAIALKNCGFDVATESRPSLGHGIDEEGLQHAQIFLQQKLY